MEVVVVKHLRDDVTIEKPNIPRYHSPVFATTRNLFGSLTPSTTPSLIS